MLTVDLLTALGASHANAQKYLPFLELFAPKYDVNTATRMAAFLAQLYHESGALRWSREIWGPTPAQLRYEGREDLGNIRPGDGRRFMGRGLIQVTGRYNYRRFTDRVRQLHPDAPDFEVEPDRLAEPKWAVLSAFDYWDRRGLNALADRGDFRALTTHARTPDRRSRVAVPGGGRQSCCRGSAQAARPLQGRQRRGPAQR